MKLDSLTITAVSTFTAFAVLGYSSGRYLTEEIGGLDNVSRKGSTGLKEVINSSTSISDPEKLKVHPWLKSSDLIYNGKRNTVPIVNEEYKVVFFLMAKVASTEFVRFFARLQDNPNWCSANIHRPYVHKLKMLNSYSVEEAQEMMTSPEWKKAIFVRHPKQRVLSAFLDKAIQYSDRFVGEYCKAYGKFADFDECVDKHEQFDFFLKKITTTLELDVHWRPIYSRIDEKWWPYIDFIGNMDTLRDDAEAFLSSIHSNVDGLSAWERIGTSGWGGKDNDDCTKNLENDMPFLGKSDPTHTTSAKEKMIKYYTPDLEAFVEQKYADDLQNPFFHFADIKLFPQRKKDRKQA